MRAYMRDLLAFILLAFLAALWGIVRPYKGLSRKQFSLLSVGCFIAFVVAPRDHCSAYRQDCGVRTTPSRAKQSGR